MALTDIVPGRVVYLWCDFIVPPHEKYIVIACLSPELLFFFINTEPNEFNGNIAKQQVLLPRSDHAFLDHDSYIDCSELMNEFTIQDIERQLYAHPKTGELKGMISPQVRQEIIGSVRWSRTLGPRLQKLVLSSFGDIPI